MNWKNVVRYLWKPFVSLLVVILIGATILALAGYNPLEGYGALLRASFKNKKAIGNMLNKSTPLLFCGLAVAVSFRGSVFNMGCEGQFLAGASVATFIGIYGSGLPGFVLIPLMMLGGAVGGALLGGVAGILKAKWGISEIISTIMLNYVASRFVSYVIRGPIYNRASGNAQSFPIAEQAYLGYIVNGTKMHIGIILAVLAAIAVCILLFHLPIGYEIRAVGFNKKAAETAGMKIDSIVIKTMLISGGLAGLAGCIEVAGTSHYLLEGLSNGYGWTGIAVSVLANNNPIGIIFTSVLMGIISAGGPEMQRLADISSSFVSLLQGMIIIAIAFGTVGHIKKAAVPKKGGK